MDTLLRRIGLLGGTFDPPHYGHLWLAETARGSLQLDRVLFLPVGTPPHKTELQITAKSHRLAMIKLAIGNNSHFVLDTTDIEREPPHTTAELLPLLKRKYANAELWLLVGADSLRDFPDWHQPGTVIAHCRLAYLPRPGIDVDLESLRTAIPGIEFAIDHLTGPTFSLSSTQIRDRTRQGQSIRYLTPTSVRQYIGDAQLYR